MPEETVNTREMFDNIFEEITEEESTAAAEAVKEEEEKPEEEKEAPEEEVEEEEEESEEEVKKEEEIEEEEEEEPEDEDSEEKEKEEVEESEEKKVDKDDEEEYTEERKITVDGEEISVSADTAFENYQRKTASDRRFKEAAESKKETEVFWDSILKNPGETLVDRIVDEFCAGDRVQARAVVVQNLLEWMEPERKAASIEDDKEKDLFRREHEMEIRQQEADRRESVRTARADREAEEEFDTNLRKELLAGFEDNDLPQDQIPIWKMATDRLKDLQAELPTSTQDDIAAIRAELVKNARRIVGEVAKVREQAIQDLVPTLSKDELVKRFPDLAQTLKTERIAKAKKKRSKKRKGNVEKQQEQKREKREKVAPQKTISTEELFRDME